MSKNVSVPYERPESRARDLNDRPHGAGPVLLWMSRDQRVTDNWALLHAADLAAAAGVALEVAFCLMPRLGNASQRHFRFMLEGLRPLEAELRGLGIGFRLLRGDPAHELPLLAGQLGAGVVVCDFSPLRSARRRRAAVADALDARLIEVDAHNVVPAWLASEKREYAAFTMRKKLERLLPDWLTDIPQLAPPRERAPDSPLSDWNAAIEFVTAADAGPPLALAPGESAAHEALDAFLADGLPAYATDRNDPNAAAQSGLSPYLHFGQLSPQRVAWEVHALRDLQGAEDFLDELITWREVAENQCLHNPAYASFEALNEWARTTLDDHRRDDREFIYSLEQLEAAETHEDLWNAAQLEMVHTGKMHGYMRMYWAKKILEWSPSPEAALSRAALLNDRYELDGRDPNGYAGIEWAIGGTLDRPWREREVYGKIRYMNENGARRKFDVDAYVNRIYELAGRDVSSDRLF